MVRLQGDQLAEGLDGGPGPEGLSLGLLLGPTVRGVPVRPTERPRGPEHHMVAGFVMVVQMVPHLQELVWVDARGPFCLASLLRDLTHGASLSIFGHICCQSGPDQHGIVFFTDPVMIQPATAEIRKRNSDLGHRPPY